MRIARNGTQYRGELENCPAVITVSKLLDFFSEIGPKLLLLHSVHSPEASLSSLFLLRYTNMRFPFPRYAIMDSNLRPFQVPALGAKVGTEFYEKVILEGVANFFFCFTYLFSANFETNF